MTNGTALPDASAQGGRMTMRVYTVDRCGTITQDCGTVTGAVDSKLPCCPRRTAPRRAAARFTALDRR
ncbi:hypothetical protein ACPCBC_29120 [Streptomyces incarnatus]